MYNTHIIHTYCINIGQRATLTPDWLLHESEQTIRSAIIDPTLDLDIELISFRPAIQVIWMNKDYGFKFDW